MPTSSFRKVYIGSTLTLAIALACATTIAYGQGTITTAAGGGFTNNVPALQSHLGSPQGVAADSAGNLFIADSGRILRVDHSTGILTAVAGGGFAIPNAGDGPALSVRITPSALAFTPSGNLLFVDSGST